MRYVCCRVTRHYRVGMQGLPPGARASVSELRSLAHGPTQGREVHTGGMCFRLIG